MSVQQFCEVPANIGSYYCKAVDFLGPVPPQFEIIYFIGFWILIGMLVVIILSPALFGNALGGRSR